MSNLLPFRIHRRTVGVVLASGALILAACGTEDGAAADDPSTDATAVEGTEPAGPDAPTVMASTTIWADVTANVACGELTVDSLTPSGVDPHDFEPSVQEADQMRTADLIIYNGLDLEEGLTDSILDAGQDGVELLEAAAVVTPIEWSGDHGHSHDDDDHGHGDDDHGHSHDDDDHGHGDDDHEHSHDGDDPHVWMDPNRVAEAVPAIEAALAGLDGLPVDDDQLRQCADDYVTALAELSDEMEAAFAELAPEQRRLVTNHEALGYLADGFDLEVIGTVIPSTSTLAEPNARELDELAETMEAAGVTRIYGEVTGANAVADALADRIGDVEVVSLYTESLGPEGSGATTYVDMMRTNTDLITGGS